jgi:hypothetical protein
MDVGPGYRAQLERYLVSLGILETGQTLSGNESAPAADEWEPALEH